MATICVNAVIHETAPQEMQKRSLGEIVEIRYVVYVQVMGRIVHRSLLYSQSLLAIPPQNLNVSRCGGDNFAKGPDVFLA